MDKIKLFFSKIGKGIANFFTVCIPNWFKNWYKAKTALCVAIALILVGSFISSIVQTDGFKVDIELKTI